MIRLPELKRAHSRIESAPLSAPYPKPEAILIFKMKGDDSTDHVRASNSSGAALRYWRRRSVIDSSKPSGGDAPSAATVLVTDNVNVSPLI